MTMVGLHCPVVELHSPLKACSTADKISMRIVRVKFGAHGHNHIRNKLDQGHLPRVHGKEEMYYEVNHNDISP